MSAFVVSNIAADLSILTSNQRFIFGNNTLPEPLGAFKLDNLFIPVTGTPSVTNFETRNNTLSGYRWIHTTNVGDTVGQLKLQSFVNAQTTGTDVLLFNQDGSVTINNLIIGNIDITSPLTIKYNAPLTILNLEGSSSNTIGSFSYFNNLNEVLLFSGTDLRIKSNNGQIHFSLDSTNEDFITFNNQGFSSIVNFVANNPDTSGFIPEKGLILQTEGTARGAVTFDHVDNQMKIYTSTNDPILFDVNNTNALKILTSGNIDLFSHKITNAADPVNPQDYATKYYVDNAIDSNFGPIETLPFNILTFNWSYVTSTNPSSYQFVNNFTDSQISKNFKYRVLTNDITAREWNHEYTLIGNSDLNGIYKINYNAVSSNFTPLSIAIYPFTTSQNLMSIEVPVDMGGFEIRNAANPTAAQSLTTRSYVDNLVANLPSLINVTGTSQTFQFNSATAKFILANTTSPSVNEYQVNFGGSIDGLRIGVSGDSPSNQFSYINTSGGSPIYFQSDGVTRMYMNGGGSFVVGTSPVGFPYARFDIFGGVQNVFNEESIIRVNSSTNSAKIEINNTAVSGRLYELRSNSDGSFDIVDRNSAASRLKILTSGNFDINNKIITNAADPINPQDYATKNYVDLAIDSSFGPNISLGFSGLNFNWGYTSGTNPTPYQFTNTFTDSQISKNFKYRVLTNDVASREWNQEYTLIGNSDLNGIYQLNYKALSSSFTPLSIVIYPFATSQNLMSIGVPVDMGGFEIRNALNPTTPQSLTTKSYVDTSVSNKSITLTGAVTGSGTSSFTTTLAASQSVTGGTQTFNYSNILTSSIFSLLNTNSLAVTGYRAGTSVNYIETGYDGSNGYSYINIASSSNDRLAFRVNGTGIAAFLATGLFGFGTITPTLAKIQINGGVQNITGEESALRAISALSSIKIELSNTSASGKLYELRSTNTGAFDITDRTSSATRFVITTAGNIGIGTNTPNAALQLANTTGNRRIVLFESVNNDHQFSGFGLNTNEVRYQVASIISNHVFYAGSSSTTSNELFRISGNGDTLTAATIYGRRVSGSLSMQGNATTTTVSTANTFVKVAGTTTSSNLNQTSMPQSNRITYTGTTSIVALIICSFTATYNTGNTDEIIFAIYKNGAQIPGSRISFDLNNVIGTIPTMPFSINIPTTLNTNDYVELWVTMTGATRIVTVSRYMMTVIAI